MTKSDIAEVLYNKIGGFSKSEALEMVEMVIGEIKKAIVEDEKVLISGFGTFSLQRKKERTGRNPQTGEPIVLSARTRVTFHPSPALKSKLIEP